MHNTCRKNACFEKIVDHLTLEVGEGDQRKIIRALAERYGVDLKALADGQMMTWDETRQLAGDPLVTIGAHTHDHFAMARLNADAACEDVTRGLERLEKELGRRPKHFAYPYGKSHAVTPRDADILREIGFASSVTTLPGVLQSVNARDPMMLPRVSLNGRFQDPAVVDQYLTGRPLRFTGLPGGLPTGLVSGPAFPASFHPPDNRACRDDPGQTCDAEVDEADQV